MLCNGSLLALHAAPAQGAVRIDHVISINYYSH